MDLFRRAQAYSPLQMTYPGATRRDREISQSVCAVVESQIKETDLESIF